MKKVVKVCFIISLIALIILTAIGVIYANKASTTPNNTEPTITPTEPTQETKTYVPDGTYYYIMGTTIAYNGEEHQMDKLSEMLPAFIFNKGQYEFTSALSDAFGEAELQDNAVIFGNVAELQIAFPVDTEHDDMWYAMYYPKQECEWKCTYNADTQTLTITHNSDFAEFKFFESSEQYAQYIRDTFLKDGSFEIYPEPHAIEGPIPGVEPSN